MSKESNVFIQTERDKKKENKNVKEQIKRDTPKTVRVKTLVIISLLVASHAIAIWVGLSIKDNYEAMINQAVEARVAELTEVPETAQPVGVAPVVEPTSK